MSVDNWPPHMRGDAYEEEYPDDDRQGELLPGPLSPESSTGKHGIITVDGYRFAPINSATFATTDYGLEWLVKYLLVRFQPCIVGGKHRRSCSPSLGTRSPWRTSRRRTPRTSRDTCLR